MAKGFEKDLLLDFFSLILFLRGDSGLEYQVFFPGFWTAISR